MLTQDGVLYGGTVLGSSGRHTAPARAFLWAFNRRGTFDNLDDTAVGLHEILAASFDTVEIEVVGSIALFTAKRPRHEGHRALPSVDQIFDRWLSV